MDKHVKIMDCTLRDGAYLLDKQFGEKNIKGIISGLTETGIDYIEIGFLQDEGFGKGKPVFKTTKEAKQFLPKDRKNSKYALLADCSRYSVENLDKKEENGVDAVRECFFKHEKDDAIKACKVIREKGYKCFVQPVDILGYSDIELIELIKMVNVVEPYCFSIVDTFGSMYVEDLTRVFEIINHNLVNTCKIGFHSHNNLQLSNALSQEFVRMSFGKRKVIVDGTVSGMGRGAGNTPTELIVEYMVSKWGYNYNLDALLDVNDNYMNHIRTLCSWGYNTPYFLAGCYGAHVNNISYLMQKNSIKSKDIRYILNKVGKQKRKRYDYDNLENIYLDYMNSNIDDKDSIEKIGSELKGKVIFILAPGSSVEKEKDNVISKIDENTVVISINFIPQGINVDYIYVSNVGRYENLLANEEFGLKKRIVASNIKTSSVDDNEFLISINDYLKPGWNHMDNSAILLLRLIDRFDIRSIKIAGLDGYSHNIGGKNFADEEMELFSLAEDSDEINADLESMLRDYVKTRKGSAKIEFITESRFKNAIL